MAGPAEATALGNLLAQMIYRRAVSTLAQGRALIERSFKVKAYEG